jgi:hypothetical protein
MTAYLGRSADAAAPFPSTNFWRYKNPMRLTTAVISTMVAAGLLAGCSGSNLGQSLPNAGPQSQIARGAHFTPASMVPAWLQPAGLNRLHAIINPDKKKKSAGLIYASQFYGSQVLGYPSPNKGNSGPSCTLGTSSNPLDDVNGFGTDSKGNVMVPADTSSGFELAVFSPKCGSSLWTASVTSGQPADAYATNATSSALVGEIIDDSTDAGALMICSKASGCGTPFSNSAVTGYGGGVTMAKDGDCWLSAEKASFSGFVLVYFKGCTGSGEVATGTSNEYYGGLFIDSKGNLGSVDLSGTLYVYSGCNPACTLVSTSTLHGESIFGGLNKKGNMLSLGDYGNSEVDVYTYSPTKGATYSYSFNTGLTSGDDSEAAHFAPSLK